MVNSLFDIPVALIFFARPDVLKESFAAIKKARPSKLFLIQDGAREGRTEDVDNIRKCRDIVNDINWVCEVHTNYSEVNLGCGMRVYSGISWAFEYVDRLIIIEDDCIVCNSFIKFCIEILERYKNDERIAMISGMNHLGLYEESPYDYFFTISGSIWGWATWKRAWDTVDFKMDFFNEPHIERLLNDIGYKEYVDRGRKKMSELESGKKLSSWTYQCLFNVLLQNMLIIVPKYNLTTNIGLTNNSAHSAKSIKLIPKGLRSIFFLETHEMEFPLKHPKYVINDVRFKKQVDRIMGFGHPVVKLYRLCESILYRFVAKDFSSILKGLKRRLGV